MYHMFKDHWCGDDFDMSDKYSQDKNGVPFNFSSLS
jgi:hypothetical protein